ITTCNQQSLCSNDGICQTPESPVRPSASSTCADIIVNNLMSYSGLYNTWHECEREFVHEQNKRMRFAAEYWMSDIFCEDSQISQSLNLYNYDGVIFESNEFLSDIFVTDDG